MKNFFIFAKAIARPAETKTLGRGPGSAYSARWGCDLPRGGVGKEHIRTAFDGAVK
jgi:hypothetical protein